MTALSFIAHGQTAVSEKPRDRSLDLPSVSPETFGGLHARPGDPWSDVAFAQPRQVAGRVVRLVGRTLSGRRRRGPRRERTAGIPRTSGPSAWTSLTFAADTPTTMGSPCASVRTCSLPPALPRSTGCGPDGEPPVSRRRRHSECRWQIPPRAPAGQHVHDGREHGTLVDRRGATALRAQAEGRQHRSTNAHRSSGTSRCDRSPPMNDQDAALGPPGDGRWRCWTGCARHLRMGVWLLFPSTRAR